jgi:hypothetical protein
MQTGITKSEFHMWLIMANNDQKQQAIAEYQKAIKELTAQILESANRAVEIIKSMNELKQ